MVLFIEQSLILLKKKKNLKIITKLIKMNKKILKL